MSPECKELFKQNDPRPCCLLPEALSPKENEDKCKEKCKDQVGDKCCAYDCENELDGLFVDGVIHKEKILKSFEIYFTETKSEGYEEWKGTLTTSFATCDALCKFFSSRGGLENLKLFLQKLHRMNPSQHAKLHLTC